MYADYVKLMLMAKMEMYSICYPPCFKGPLQFATLGESINFQECCNSSLILLSLTMKSCIYPMHRAKEKTKQNPPKLNK